MSILFYLFGGIFIFVGSISRIGGGEKDIRVFKRTVPAAIVVVVLGYFLKHFGIIS